MFFASVLSESLMFFLEITRFFSYKKVGRHISALRNPYSEILTFPYSALITHHRWGGVNFKSVNELKLNQKQRQGGCGGSKNDRAPPGCIKDKSVYTKGGPCSLGCRVRTNNHAALFARRSQSHARALDLK